MWVRWPEWSKRVKAPRPVRPARRAAWKGATPQPSPETTPKPVTTTRRLERLPRAGKEGCRLAPALDELGEAGDRREDFTTELLALDLDAELLLERDHQLQGIHGIEPQALAEERGIVLDHFGFHPVQVQAGDDQPLDTGRSGLSFRHIGTSGIRHKSNLRTRLECAVNPSN